MTGRQGRRFQPDAGGDVCLIVGAKARIRRYGGVQSDSKLYVGTSSISMNSRGIPRKCIVCGGTSRTVESTARH